MDRQVVIISLLSLLMMSCYDSFKNYTYDNQGVDNKATTTISHIHSMYESGTREINQDIIIEGVVTANDEFGNFFKCFIIEQDGYAIEILDGLYDSYIRHPLGSKVTLRLQGLCLDRYMGVLRVGLKAPSTSSYALDDLTSEAIVDLHVTVSELGIDVSPSQFEIGELDDSYAGRLIHIENITLHTEDGVERTWREYSLFRDSKLDSIWCYTSPYADFASEFIPQCSLSLTGILEFGNTYEGTNQFIIKLHGPQDYIY